MNWKLAEQAPAEFAENIGVPQVIASVLWQRGIRTALEAEQFLHPIWEVHIHNPYLFKNMTRAVERIFSALEKNEHIVLHGDYDADGVTGSAVLFETLNLLRVMLSKAKHPSDSKITSSIPDREKEGYGLSMSTVEKLHGENTKLIITIDCGIASVAESDYAHSLGIDTIIVDHHAMPPKLSQTAIIIHPHVEGETYPFKPLAAVGVAYKLATGLLQEATKRRLDVPFGFEKWLLDFVAIATVTDVVPLIGENRVLEKFGLKVLQKTRRPGFLALYHAARIEPEKIDTTTVGFQIGPRINAAGRMRHARLAFDLLTAQNEETAKPLAEALEQANRDRQDEMNRLIEQALKDTAGEQKEKVICLARENWPHGLVGLVASRLVQTYHLPAYVVGITERGIVGSGRGIPGFHVTEAIKAQAECLTRFGGHPQACGFSIKSAEHIEQFFAGLKAFARENLSDADVAASLVVDAEVPLSECSLQLAKSLELLEPYGEGNPRPVFLARGVRMVAFDRVGAEGKHLRITGEEKGTRLKMIAFNMGERAKELALGCMIDVIYELTVNVWNGFEEQQLKVRDFEVSS